MENFTKYSLFLLVELFREDTWQAPVFSTNYLEDAMLQFWQLQKFPA